MNSVAHTHPIAIVMAIGLAITAVILGILAALTPISLKVANQLEKAVVLRTFR